MSFPASGAGADGEPPPGPETSGEHAGSTVGVGFHMPLGVALLLAAIAGALIVGIVGTARIVQLRRHARRRR